MMERDFITQKNKEAQIKKYLENKLSNVGLSQIKLKKIPLGEKIIVYTSRPSLIVGSKGSNIKDLTRYLKKEFKLENPQIEINEIKNIFLDANVVAERIAFSLERFGSARFKGIGHKTIENVMKAGAMGVEIIISGKIPGARAKSWRFYQGYLKKCGDVSVVGVRKAQKSAKLKSGIIGIKVAIMPPDVELPDKIDILDEPIELVEEIQEKEKKKGKTRKKSTKTNKKTSTGNKSKKKEETDKKSQSKEKPVEKESAEKPAEEEASKPAEEKTQESAEKTSEEESPVDQELAKKELHLMGNEDAEEEQEE